MATTYKFITSTTLASTTANVTFTNISAAYTDLVILGYTRDNSTGNYSNSIYTQYGSDSASNYKNYYTFGTGSSTLSNVATYGYNYMVFGSNGPQTTAGQFSSNEMYLSNYLTAGTKMGYTHSSTVNSAGNGGTSYTAVGYTGTQTANTLVITPQDAFSFVAGTVFYVYGIYESTITATPLTPTIGTATASNDTSGGVSITFTPQANDNAMGYTMVSTPGSIIGSGNSSPILVTGLTNGTAYTFQVKAVNQGSESALSSASNSATPNYIAGWDSIASANFGGTSSFNFTSIAQTYKALRLVVQAEYGTTSDPALLIRANSDSSSIYAQTTIYNDGGTGTAVTNSNSNTGITTGQIPRSTFQSRCLTIVEIQDYSDTTKPKMFRIFHGSVFGSADATYEIREVAGIWNSNAAITALGGLNSVIGNFLSGSSAQLYGMK